MQLNHLFIEDEKIKMYCKTALSPQITREFTEAKESKEGDLYLYTFEILPNMCFAIRALIAKFKVFTAEYEVLVALVEQTKFSTMPILSLYETGKHVQISCPPMAHYLEFISAIGASPKGMNNYTIPIARAYDAIRAVSAKHLYLPNFLVTQDLLESIRDSLSGFDGSIASLFNTDIEQIKAVANAYRVPVENFKAMGYNNIADFLVTQPRRYIDKTKITDLSEIEPKEQITVVGEIIEKKLVYYKHMNFKIKVGENVFDCMYYHRAWMEDKFNLGDEVLMMGDYQGKSKVVGISLESLVEAKSLDIVPIYPQSSKYKITSKVLLNVVYEAIERIKPYSEKLAPYINKDELQMSLGRAIVEMHFPTSSESYVGALETLAMYELIYLQLLISDRKANEVKDKGIPKPYRPNGFFDAMKASFPWELTDAQNSGLEQFDKYMSSATSEQVLLTADVGSGKGLLEDELIVTPNGWEKLKNIKVGDIVIGRNAQPTKVTGVYPQGKQELAKLSFSDGVEIITDLEHRWTVVGYEDSFNQSNETVLSTRELLSSDYSEFKIPLLGKPVDFENDPSLNTNPYSVGEIIGIDSPSKDYSIPEIYMKASLSDRVNFTKGLFAHSSIDSDGFIVFESESKSVLSQTAELVQSLGGVAINNQESLLVKLPTFMARNSLNSVDTFNKTIVKIEKLDYKKNTICIKVDALDENFLTKGYTVTHNTVIGQLACMQALDNGYQSALAAPTEVLAVQLYDNFVKTVDNMPKDKQPTVAFMGGKTKAKEKREILKYVKSGDIDILIGTHSILSNKIEYRNLGLIVIDEQQKFGKAQREALMDVRNDGLKPDLLAQTATPIPRSTAQAFYGDINMISLNGKPKGRIEIKTEWVKSNPKTVTKEKDNPMWKDIMSEIEKGHQVFVVVPMVYESLKMDSASVEGAYKDLKKILPKAKIGFTHGTLKKDAQHEAMEAFRNNETNILVASTVIEVGVDVPNATRIVILSADRMGASSLHQIRGRVGRSNLESTCYLVSEGKSATSKRRLQALVDSPDGFEIAKIDLETRGEGDLFGARQAGDSGLRFSSLVNHGKLIGEAQKMAKEIYESEYKDLAIKDAKAILGSDDI